MARRISRSTPAKSPRWNSCSARCAASVLPGGVSRRSRSRQLRAAFSIAARIILWSGILFGLPGIVAAIGHFVFPGLKPREKKCVTWASACSAVLFAGGVCLGYRFTIPVAVRLMLRINRWIGINCEFFELGDFVSFVM